MTIDETRERLQRLINISQDMIDRGASVAPKELSKDIECYKSALEIISDYKTGNWVVNAHGNVNCDNCGYERSINNQSNYCPNCGASMKTPKDKHCDILNRQCINPYKDCKDCEIQAAYDMGRGVFSG